MTQGTQRVQTNPDPHREPPLKGKVLAKGADCIPRARTRDLWLSGEVRLPLRQPRLVKNITHY